MEDTLNQSQKKYYEWIKDAENTGYSDLWDLLSIINQSEHADTFRQIIYNQTHMETDSKNINDFWISGIYQVRKDVLLEVLKQQLEIYLPNFQKITSIVLEKIILSSEYSISKLKNMKMKILINEDNNAVVLLQGKDNE